MRGGGLQGLSQWVQLCTWSPNKLWRSNSIFNLWALWCRFLPRHIFLKVHSYLEDVCLLFYSYNMVAVKYIFQSVEAKQSVEGGNRSTRLSQQGGEQPPAKKRPSLPTPQKSLPPGTSAVNGTYVQLIEQTTSKMMSSCYNTMAVFSPIFWTFGRSQLVVYVFSFKTQLILVNLLLQVHLLCFAFTCVPFTVDNSVPDPDP